MGVKTFAHVCVFPSRDLNTNVSDEEDSSASGSCSDRRSSRGSSSSNSSRASSDEDEHEGGASLKAKPTTRKYKTKKERKERRRVRRNEKLRHLSTVAGDNLETECDSGKQYAKFAFHVAGRKNKLRLLLRMAACRSIPLPVDLSTELLMPFNARPPRFPTSRSESAFDGTASND